MTWRATGSSVTAQSTAESPPPTMTTSLVAELVDPLGEVVDAFAFELGHARRVERFGSKAPTPAQMITVLL